VEFLWSVPAQNKPVSPPQVAHENPITPPQVANNNPAPPPRVANSGSKLQTDIAPVRHHRKHRDVAPQHRPAGHHHRHSDLAHISASTVAEFSAPPASSSDAAASREVLAVQQRLRTGLRAGLFKYFELFLYVSKAVNGPLAQRMYVFQKSTHGDLDLLYDWPVSTGRDRTERNDQGVELLSFTPAGTFKLDPHRFYRSHVSSEWRQPMPFAMFFERVERGAPTGLAIHAATGDGIAALGTRASAGCVRLAPEAAETLYMLVRSRYRGLTPRFAVNHRSGTTNSNGIILHDARGRVELTEGYKALVMIENYGGENLVAAIY
jgi:hypothetical protein